MSTEALPLKVAGLSARYGVVPALNDVSITVGSGEIVTLIGANGAGKSTLIKTLAGVHKPDAGEIRWNGEVVAMDNPQDAIDLGIATMYQELDVVDALRGRPEPTVADQQDRAGLRRRSRHLLLGDGDAHGGVGHGQRRELVADCRAETGRRLRPLVAQARGQPGE